MTNYWKVTYGHGRSTEFFFDSTSRSDALWTLRNARKAADTLGGVVSVFSPCRIASQKLIPVVGDRDPFNALVAALAS